MGRGTDLDQAAEVELIRSLVASHFKIYDAKVSMDAVVVMITPDPSSLEAEFEKLRKEMKGRGYIPILEYKQGEYQIAVIRSPSRRMGRNWLNLTLLAITTITTVLTGMAWWASYTSSSALLTADNIIFGTLFFAAPLMTILGVHELSHYLMSKRHGLDASLPYFIPSIPPLGTFGAFISIREPMPSKKALVDIGAAGPIAGFLVTIPFALLGLYLNAQGPTTSALATGGATVVNFPVFYDLLSLFVPQPAGLMSIHPLAFAAWVGFFVTAINLLPAGQLDGGHIARGLLGERAKYLSIPVVGVLLIIGFFYYLGWLLFAFLIMFLGMRHPAPLNDVTRLDAKRVVVGALCLLILAGSFVPIPLQDVPIDTSYSIEPIGSNTTTVIAGETAIFEMSVNNTGNVDNFTAHLYVENVPIGWGVGLYESTGPPSNATNTLDLVLPYNSAVGVTLEILVPSLAHHQNYTIAVVKSSSDPISSGLSFTVRVV